MSCSIENSMMSFICLFFVHSPCFWRKSRATKSGDRSGHFFGLPRQILRSENSSFTYLITFQLKCGVPRYAGRISSIVLCVLKTHGWQWISNIYQLSTLLVIIFYILKSIPVLSEDKARVTEKCIQRSMEINMYSKFCGYVSFTKRKNNYPHLEKKALGHPLS